MVYDFGVKDGDFYQVLQKSKETGSLICVHAENKEVLTTLTEQFAAEGKLSPWYHYASRPEFVAGEADRRAIAWARSLNAPLYIVHMSDKEGVEAVTAAKDEGLEIYGDLPPLPALHPGCLQAGRRPEFRLLSTHEGPGESGCPVGGCKAGDVDTIATDHCPFQQSEKDWGQGRLP